MIKELNRKEFDEQARVFPQLTFYQSAAWSDVKRATGWGRLFIAYEKEGQIEGLGLILLKKMPLLNNFLAYCPRGFLFNYCDLEALEEFNQEIIAYLKEKRVFQLIIDPYLPLQPRDIDGQIIKGFDNHCVVEKLIKLGYNHTGYNLNYENLQPRWLFRLNVQDKSIEEIQKGYKKEAKRRANKKDYFAINVRELKKKEIPVFKELMLSTAKRKGFIDRPLSYYASMYKALHPSGILHYMVAEIDIEKCRHNVLKEIEQLNEKIAKISPKNEGKLKEENITLQAHEKVLEQLDQLQKEKGDIVPLSVVCLLCWGNEMIMLLAGNNEQYLQHFNTSNIIVDQLIKKCKQEGYKYYNFYGITGNFDPNHPSYGLYTYKKQYGGEVLELIGQFEYTINKTTKNIYDKMLKVYRLTKR